MRKKMPRSSPLASEMSPATLPLQVGQARVDVTPPFSVEMGGSAAKRLSEGVLDPLYFTCIALRQDETLILLVTVDLVGAYKEFTLPCRRRMAAAVGIPEENVILNGTHTHSSVAIRGVSEKMDRYRALLAERAAEAAKAAVADLAESTLSYGSVFAEGMVWQRHYRMADGSFAGANYGSFRSGILGHVAEADPEVQLLRFSRKEKPDVILMSFGAHATINQKSLLLSADFPAAARNFLEEKTGARVAYFIAGGGDQVPISRIPEENFTTDYQLYGAELGRRAAEGLLALTATKTGRLTLKRREYVGRANKTDLDRIGEAQAVKAVWDAIGGRGTPEGRAAAKERGFESVYEVTAILNRQNTPDTRSLTLTALSLGEVCLIFAPYEMFGASAHAIKTGSPYPMTFVISCSQDHVGYLPSEKGWQMRCYEAQITRFARGSAEELVEEYLSLLQETVAEAR